MFELLSEPWWWVIGGLLLVLSEFAVPGFVVCFFGVAAIIVGVLTGLFPEMWMGAKLLVFGVGGLVLMLACRRFMPKDFRGKRQLATDDPDEERAQGQREIEMLGDVRDEEAGSEQRQHERLVVPALPDGAQ